MAWSSTARWSPAAEPTSPSRTGASPRSAGSRPPTPPRCSTPPGMIVAPGFVDLHTHYDCAFFYDPWCSLSGWHGVTSVAIGNCGFGFAPAREADRDYLMRTLTRVEAIPREVMELSLPWTWESFPEWMDALDDTPKGVNALTYVPLNPLLVYVMGLDAAKERDATDEERAEMCRLLKEAMDAGACGWSAQRTAARVGLRRPAGPRRHAVRHRPDVERDGPGPGRRAEGLRPRLHPDADRPAGRPDGQEPRGGGQRQERGPQAPRGPGPASPTAPSSSTPSRPTAGRRTTTARRWPS